LSLVDVQRNAVEQHFFAIRLGDVLEGEVIHVWSWEFGV
jgi:hypothetical protein